MKQGNMMDINDYISSLFSPVGGMPAGLDGTDAYGRLVGGGAGRGASVASAAGMAQTNAYENEYRPYDRQFMNYVDSIGSNAYRGEQRGRAMNDVQLQTDAQRQQMERQGAAAGVNYGDPRFAFMRGQMAQQTALNKVMAAMGSDRSARDEWSKGLGAINAMGLKVGEMGMRNQGMSGELAKVGMAGMDMGPAARDRNTQAAASMTSAGASAANAANSGANSERNYQLGLGRLALDRYGLETGNALKIRGLDTADRANSFGNTFLSSAGGAATNWLINGGAGKLAGGISNLFGGSGSGFDHEASDASYGDYSGGMDIPSDLQGYDW